MREDDDLVSVFVKFTQQLLQHLKTSDIHLEREVEMHTSSDAKIQTTALM